jgi:hypothetical protein
MFYNSDARTNLKLVLVLSLWISIQAGGKKGRGFLREEIKFAHLRPSNLLPNRTCKSRRVKSCKKETTALPQVTLALSWYHRERQMRVDTVCIPGNHVASFAELRGNPDPTVKTATCSKDKKR